MSLSKTTEARLTWFMHQPDKTGAIHLGAPAGRTKFEQLDRVIRKINRFHTGRLFNSTDVDNALMLWIHHWAALRCESASASVDECHKLLKRGLYACRDNFRVLCAGLEIDWPRRGGVGCGGLMRAVREDDWSAPSFNLNPTQKRLCKIQKYLDAVSAAAGSASESVYLRCSRGSNTSSAVLQRAKSGLRVYRCSASKMGGLATHEPFLFELAERAANCVVFPDRTRAGRSGAAALVELLGACGVGCVFEQSGVGVDAEGRSTLKYMEDEGADFSGCVLLPSLCAAGFPLVGPGVRLVPASCVPADLVVRSVLSPGLDYRAVASVLALGRLGLVAPVRIGPSVFGRAVYSCREGVFPVERLSALPGVVGVRERIVGARMAAQEVRGQLAA